ncbi:hypothetical protein LCGC14_2775650, partial [marine sediment metagenome]
MKKKDYEPRFVDAEQYQGQSHIENLSFKEILLRHLKRITELASKEMRGGFWETKSQILASSMVAENRYYVADTREEYSNAVDCLADLLLPYFDKKMVVEEKENDKKLESEYKKCFAADEEQETQK